MLVLVVACRPGEGGGGVGRCRLVPRLPWRERPAGRPRPGRAAGRAPARCRPAAEPRPPSWAWDGGRRSSPGVLEVTEVRPVGPSASQQGAAFRFCPDCDRLGGGHR
jgi:hypothetical protein